MEFTKEEIEREVDDFTNQIYNKVIELIETNQEESREVLKEPHEHSNPFHRGGIAFGDVIIYEINTKLKLLN